MTSELVARFQKRFSADVSIDVDYAQLATSLNVTALFGPSGCGKTTLLRCFAGLTQPDEGIIEFQGQTWFSSKHRTALSTQQRDIGFLFQDYALFPHFNVADNIGFGLRRGRDSQRRERVAELIEMFGLRGVEQRFPHQLSGGQQQRTALARALARKPRLLLLDEPLSALDTTLREQLRGELRRVLVALSVPVLMVTHDRVEAIALADRVAVMNQGRIQQIGAVPEVFARPKNAALAKLVGIETVAAGEIIGVHEGLASVRVGRVDLLAVAPEAPVRYVYACIKGEDVALQKGASTSSSIRNNLPAIVTSLTAEGPLVRVGLDCGFELTSLITRPASEDLRLEVGDAVTAMLKTPAVHLVPRPGARHTE